MDQPQKYFLANDPITGALYATHPTKRLIVKIEILEHVNNLKTNVRIDDRFCSSQNDCHIGGPSHKHMQYPKGFQFDKNGAIYFIDGSLVKMVTQDGFIRTIAGSTSSSSYRPMGCNSSHSYNETQFFWPTSLAINPLDNTVYVLDEGVIYKLTNFNTTEIVAGTPRGCKSAIDESRWRSKSDFIKLFAPVDMAFNPEGDLYILENDHALNIKQIRVLKSTGEIESFFGEQATSRRIMYKLDSESAELNLKFNDPTSIAVHPNRSVYVLDRGDNVLYHIRNQITRDEYTGKYSISSPKTRESYFFNRFGLHLQTADMDTGKVLFNFTYQGNALYGKLTSVADQNRQIVGIKRDFQGRAESLKTPNGVIKVNNF